MIRSFAALAYNGFREARRNKVTAVVVAFAAAMVFSSALAIEAVVSTLNRVVVDIGLGALSLMLVLLAIYLSSGLLNREIERRTIFLIVTKPVSRGTFLVARLVGNMFTLGVLAAAMTLVFLIQLASTHTPVLTVQFQAIVLLWFELLVLSSVGLTLSTFSTPIVSGLITLGVYFAGHLSGDIYALGDKAKSPATRAISRVVYYVLPNLERLNLRPQAAYQMHVSAAACSSAILYALAYSGCLIVIGVVIFSRRDFK